MSMPRLYWVVVSHFRSGLGARLPGANAMVFTLPMAFSVTSKPAREL